MTEAEIRCLIRDEFSRLFTENKVQVDGMNIKMEAILSSRKYKAALAANKKLTHEQRVANGRLGGRGNKKYK
jgi:hypothetical protein